MRTLTTRREHVRPRDRSPGTGADRREEGAWVALGGLLMLLVGMFSTLGRFVEWDEAVFLSQSGGLAGMSVPPSSMSASREIGPAVLLGLLRIVAEDLSTIRLLWALVCVVMVVVGFRQLSFTIGSRPALVGGVVFGASWLVVLYSTSFFGNLLAATFSLTAVGLYLRLRAMAERSQGVRVAALLALALAASFWLRQIETLLVVVVLIIHSLLVRPSRIWRGQLAPVGVAGGVLIVAFAIPWLVDSSARYGSVGERIQSALNQGWPTGWGNRAPDYIRSLLGDPITFTASPSLTDLLTAGRVLQAIVLIVGISGGLFVFTRSWGRAIDRDRLSAAALIGGIAAVSFGFFFFYAGGMSDRYVMFGWLFTCAVLGWGISATASSLQNVLSHRLAHGAFLALVTLWIVSQLLILRPFEVARLHDAIDSQGVSETIRTLAAGEPCEGVTRYGAPQRQLGTGCRFRSVASLEQTEASLEEYTGASNPRFVVTTRSQAPDGPLPEGWHLFERPRPSGNAVYIYAWLPNEPAPE